MKHWQETKQQDTADTGTVPPSHPPPRPARPLHPERPHCPLFGESSYMWTIWSTFPIYITVSHCMCCFITMLFFPLTYVLTWKSSLAILFTCCTVFRHEYTTIYLSIPLLTVSGHPLVLPINSPVVFISVHMSPVPGVSFREISRSDALGL